MEEKSRSGMSMKNAFWLKIGGARLMGADGNRLDAGQVLSFWNLCNMLGSSGGVTFVGRGESDENLRAQFLGTDSSDPVMLSSYIFVLGEKGRICRHDGDFTDPEDISPDAFRRMCGLIHSAVADAGHGSAGRVGRMARFADENPEFFRGFGHGYDADSLVRKYGRLDAESRRAVNMCYLSMLHTINASSYRSQSGFISMTGDGGTAERFGRGLVLVGWIPAGRGVARIFMHDNCRKEMRVPRESGLPYCRSAVYPEQREISVLYGLLPHFIIGFFVRNSFYVNPAVFDTMAAFAGIDSMREMQKLRRRVVCQGLDVDQSDFRDIVGRTSYRRYFTFDGDHYSHYENE